MFYNLTPHDLLKDSFLAAFGFIPTALTQVHVALILGLLNLAVVVTFRLIELRRRSAREEEIERLQARIDELVVVRATNGEAR